MSGRRVAGLGLACVAVVAGACAATAGAAPRGAGAAQHALAGQVLVQINRVRAQHGLAAVQASPGLRAAADQHSAEMAADGYFDHASHDGTSFAKRLEHFYPSSGYRRWMVGETLLWSSPDVDAAAAVEDWLASPPHRRILLTPSWRQIGISAVHETSAPGVYGGLEVTIITADFGVRSH